MKKELSPKLFKHFKKITSNVASRPALKCVFYDIDGSLSATDSHRLIYLKNFHNYDKPLLQNPETMEILTEQSFPAIKHLIPEIKEDTYSVTIDANELKLGLRAVGNSKLKAAKMKLFEHGVELRNNCAESSLRVYIEARINNQSFDDIGFNVTHLLDALMFATDFIPKLDDKIVTIYFNETNVRPFAVTTNKDEYIYIVTPLRMA